jgi:hypothetical protein
MEVVMDWYTEIIAVIKKMEISDGSIITIYRNGDVTLRFIVIKEKAGNYYLDFPTNNQTTVH